MQGRTKRALLPTAVALYVLLIYSICILPMEQIEAITVEDGLSESTAAAYLLTCSLFFLLSYYHSARTAPSSIIRFKRNIFYLLLGIMFFIGCMEEISWGQRLFNLEPPETVLKYNQQNELNIHNLRWFHRRDDLGQRKDFWGLLLHIDRLFSVFWLTFCFLIPLLNKISVQVQRLIQRLKFPLVALPLGTLFVINYLVSKVFEFTDPVTYHGVAELKEHNIAFLFLVVALLEFRKVKHSHIKQI